MYGILIDRESGFHAARQVCDRLRELVLAGELPAGTRLPSTRAAAAGLGIARNTLAEAYDQLVAEGYLEGRPGSGTYVAAVREPVLRAPGRAAAPGARPPAAPRLAAHHLGGKLRARPIDFASAAGTPDLSLFPLAKWAACFKEALAGAREEDLGFGDGADVRGDPGYRAALAELLFRVKGIEAGPERIFATAGITEAVLHLALFLRPRFGAVALEDPGYPASRRCFERAGYAVERLPVDAEGVTPPPAPARRVYLATPAHQYPAGAILSARRRLALLAAARAEGSLVVEDDYDGDMRHRGVPVPPLCTLAPDLVFHAGTFNKTLYPSLRAGYLVVPAAQAGPFALFKQAISGWTSLATQRALALFVAGGHYERHALRLRRAYAARRARAEALAAGMGARVEGADAGAHCRLVFPALAGRRVDWRELEGRGALVAAIGDFARDRGPWAGQLMVGFGNLDAAAIERGLALVAEFAGEKARG